MRLQPLAYICHFLHPRCKFLTPGAKSRIWSDLTQIPANCPEKPGNFAHVTSFGHGSPVLGRRLKRTENKSILPLKNQGRTTKTDPE
jgi:hypothetical protein